MTKLILLLATLAGAAFAQNPAQCLYSGVWVPCSMIPTVQEAQTVNVKVSGGAGTTITQAFGVATTKGNTILCLGMESAAAIPVITDADGNTFAVVASSATAPGYTIAVANNILGTSTDTITLTTTSGAAAFACHEIKGSVPIGQVWDLSNGQQGTGATITYANTAATIPGEMILTAVGLGAGSVNATPALGGNNTSLVTVDANNTAVTGGAALSIFYAAHTSLSTLANFTQTESLNASQTYSGVIVSIKPPTMVNGPSNTAYLSGVAIIAAAPGVQKVGVVGNAGAAFDAATGAAPPANAIYQGGLVSGATGGLVGAPTFCDQWVAINGTASVQLIAGVSGRKIYFCSVNLQMNGGANTVSFVSGTGSVCATGITAIPGFDGATSAANGYSFAANSGVVLGGGASPFARTTNNADNVCILIGTATRVVGGANYAIY